MTKNLGAWQVVSLISRFSALFIGIIQSVLIARILSVSEFGVIGLVGAIGAMAGIAQHLGLASGTTREISASTERKDIFKILLSSVVIKYVITIPLSLFLVVGAPFIASNVYNSPEIDLPIRLYGLVLLVQGVQSIFNSVIAGLQKFKQLFIYQIAIACVSLLVYIPLIYMFKVNGYFYALIVFNVIGSVTLGILALIPLRDCVSIPSKKDFTRIFKNVFVLSVGIYLAKVLYTLWYKLGQLTLGYFSPLEAVGVFSFGLLYASKLQTVSDAVTDVNLPVFSKEFSENFENFKKLFRQNFNKLFAFILFSGVSAIYWSPEIFQFAVGNKYDSAIRLLPFLVLSFAFYSYVNLLKSSVFIPAKQMKGLIIGYASMVVSSLVLFMILRPVVDPLMSMAMSMLLGAVVGFLVLGLIVRSKLNFSVVDNKDFAFSLFMFCYLMLFYMHLAFLPKLILFSLVTALTVWLVQYLKIVNFNDFIKKVKK